jgi:hypothetical protein
MFTCTVPVNRFALIFLRKIAGKVEEGELFIQILAPAKDGKGLSRT